VHAPAILKLRWQLATLEREHDLERKEAEVEARAQAEVKKEVEELVVALERQGDTTQRQASARACPPLPAPSHQRGSSGAAPLVRPA